MGLIEDLKRFRRFRGLEDALRERQAWLARFSTLDDARAALERERAELGAKLEYERAWLTEVYGIEASELDEAASAVDDAASDQEGPPQGGAGAP
jgi:hypothetical protein